MVPVVRRRRTSLRVAKLVRALTALFLFSLVLDGPLRFLFAAKGLMPLIYVPKILLLLAIPCLIVARWRISRGFVTGVAIVALSLIWGAVNLASPNQALFGLWVLVPLLYGLLVTRYMLDESEAYRRLFWMLFVIAVTGVLLNPFFNYPWVGASLEIGGTNIEISRQWGTAGFDRYAGFSRASFGVASQLLLLATWLVATGRNRWNNLAVWLVAGVGIVMTTSKGPVAAWVALTLFFLSGALLHYRKSWRRTWAAALFLVLAVVVALPLSTLFIVYHTRIDSLSDALLLASFGERLSWMWPDSMALLHDIPEWLIGRGLGGIGAAQFYFDPQHSLSADNIFVYLAVEIGPLMAGTMLFMLTRKISATFITDRKALLAFALLFALVTYGLVTNIIEDSLLSLLLGVVIAASSRSARANG